MNIRLNGISFADLPFIGDGEEVTVKREKGELWDSDARPAYSVRLNCMHVGYIPLVETLKEEALKAKFDGLKKKWREGMEGLTPAQLRAISTNLNETGELIEFHEWVETDPETARNIARNKMLEAEFVEEVRDFLYVEICRNHLTPVGRISPAYYDDKHGYNHDGIGNVCSIYVTFDMNCCYNPLATQTSAAKAADEASDSDQS